MRLANQIRIGISGDGFASVTPASAAGVLTTMPLSFGSPGAAVDAFLFVNVVAVAGASLSVELLVDGESRLSSATIRGQADSTKLMVRWATAANGTAQSLGHWPPPSAVPQLRFTLKGDVQLFAFWLTNDARCGSSNGPVAGGGRGFGSGWDRRDDSAPCASPSSG